MDVEGIKDRVRTFKNEWAGAEGIFDKGDFLEEVGYLLSILEQAEKALESASKQLWDDQVDLSLEYGCWSKDMGDSDVLKEVKSALQVIRGN